MPLPWLAQTICIPAAPYGSLQWQHTHQEETQEPSNQMEGCIKRRCCRTVSKMMLLSEQHLRRWEWAPLAEALPTLQESKLWLTCIIENYWVDGRSQNVQTTWEASHSSSNQLELCIINSHSNHLHILYEKQAMERFGYLEHLLDLLPWQIHVEFVKKLQNLTDA